MLANPFVRNQRQRAHDLAQEATRGIPVNLDTKQVALLLKWPRRRVYDRFIGEPGTRKRSSTIFYQVSGSWYVNTADLLSAWPKVAEALMAAA